MKVKADIKVFKCCKEKPLLGRNLVLKFGINFKLKVKIWELKMVVEYLN